MTRGVWLASSTPGVDWTPGEYYSKHKIAKANRAAYDPRLGRDCRLRFFAAVGPAESSDHDRKWDMMTFPAADPLIPPRELPHIGGGKALVT